ncbi:MAG TPA: hypothetical protein VH442_08690, partial [Micromonosporaceae bacterium]
MAFYKAFAETRVGSAGTWQKFLLDLDLSQAVGGAVVTNQIKVDPTAPGSDATIRITPASIQAEQIEIEIAPVVGRTISNGEIRIYLNTDDDPAGAPLVIWKPVGTDTFPSPSNWVYVSYRGDPGQVLPASLMFHLSKRAMRAPGATGTDPFVTDDVDIVVISTPVAGPLHLTGGMLAGPIRRSTDVYNGQNRSDVATIALDAP